MNHKILYNLFFISSLQVTLVHAGDMAPSIELLEYLAEMEMSSDEENNSEWIDLLAMKEIENTQTIESTQEQGNE